MTINKLILKLRLGTVEHAREVLKLHYPTYDIRETHGVRTIVNDNGERVATVSERKAR